MQSIQEGLNLEVLNKNGMVRIAHLEIESWHLTLHFAYLG